MKRTWQAYSEIRSRSGKRPLLPGQDGARALLCRPDFANFDPKLLADLDCLAPAVKMVIDVQVEQVFARLLESNNRPGADRQKLSHLDLLFGEFDDNGDRQPPQAVRRGRRSEIDVVFRGFGHDNPRFLQAIRFRRANLQYPRAVSIVTYRRIPARNFRQNP